MDDLRTLLSRQDLVVSRAQALQHGVSRHAWDWKLSRGIWQPVIDGIAVAHTGELTPVQRAWGAVLHAGTGAALSGDALLHLIGFPLDPPKTLDVVVAHSRRVVDATLPDGTEVKLRRASRLPALRDSRRALPAVTRHVAVLHAAAWATSDRAAEWRIAAMVQRQLSAVPLLREALVHLARLPRRALLRTVLDDVELGVHAASEFTFLRFLRRHGLPRPDELQVKVRTGASVSYLDGRYRAQRVTIEVDGAHHRDAETWDADALRNLRLVVAMPGERMVRLTMSNLRHDGPEVAELLRELLLPSGKVCPPMAG